MSSLPAHTFTEAQARAIFSEGSVAISAGAGSGKTRVLAERILNFLARGVRPAQIVAVTFTEAAAAELRERVTAVVGRRAEAEGGHWPALVTDLALMTVGTIHSLCARVAREHPVESGAGLGFRVLDELEARAWLEENLTPVLAEVQESERETLLAVPGKIRHAVLEALLDDPSSAREALRVAVAARTVDPSERAQRAWKAALPTWQAAVAALEKVSGPRGDVLEEMRSRAVTLGRQAPLLGQDLLAVREALREHSGRIGKGWAAPAKKEVNAALAVLGALAARDDLAGVAGEASAAHDRAVLALDRLFDHVSRRFAALKAEQEVATFADLESFADAALAHGPVRAYYTRRWTHLLIDEAQDTNPVQWRILSALAGEGVNLTVVGDEKQSIYAFRRADVQVFRAAQEEVQARAGEVIPMGTSFRTHAALVGILNAFFASLMAGPDEKRPTAARFEALSAHRFPSPLGEDAPCVEVYDIQGADVGAARAAEAQLLAARIQDLLYAGTPVYDRDLRGTRPLRLGDVAVLLRARTHLPTYEQALAAAGLPYVVHGGRGLYDRPEVQDAAGLLRVVADPTADIPLAAFLRGPHVCLTDQTLLDLARLREPGESLWDAAQRSEDPAVGQAAAWIQDWRGASVTLSASQLLMEADRVTGAALVHAAMPDGARRAANLARFRALLRSWAQAGVRDVVRVAGHLAALERLGAQEAEAVSPSPDAVQLMTIHGSKGLEFPVVIVADVLNQGGGPPPRVRFDAAAGVALRLPGVEGDLPDWEALEALAEERELSENERVAYVAFTRAADLLVLLAPGNLGAAARKRFETFVAHLPPEGVTLTYAAATEVRAPRPLPPAAGSGPLRLDVATGPGVILPGTLPVTSLGTYLQCPRLFAYRHLEGREGLVSLWSEREAAERSNPEGRLAGRQIGDAVHRALEHGWDRAAMRERFGYFASADFQTVVTLVEAMAGEAFSELRGRPFEREKAIQVPLGRVTFEGIVDAFDPEGALVLDYKTDKEVRPEHHLPQLALYAHHLGAREAALAYLRHGALHTFTAEELERGLAAVQDTARRMEALDFAPTPSASACRMCSFRGVCDAAVGERS
ncbi:ATP-dependent exoDNAse (exonuclease V) beta subunit (contains helicase and exonuclease domains) [Deinococcus reticulitermitis]|uniref:DNA 3'-5' helicase n=1 Tax=Deinococcus reticulitermitis TaxID=856736 RepID=A0A1H7CA88_9DEIO|nr:UvrD-helicase domain-containing protein [Deinococcus reticulitermitis]SEJ86548.1 ATP-dependent exoDNAse (exonuclease V) beta subunit (contains helicase and exonuclease domains) [Deinococcus reticulitermitis]